MASVIASTQFTQHSRNTASDFQGLIRRHLSLRFIQSFDHLLSIYSINIYQTPTHHIPGTKQHHSLGALTLYCCCCAAAKSLQSCPTLCDPIDGSPPGSAVPGILQVRIMEWVAISFSKHYTSTHISVKVTNFHREL